MNGEKRQIAAAMIPPEVIDDSMILPKDTDTIKFQQTIDLFSNNVHQEFKPKEMLETPISRIKETKTNIDYIMERRRKAKEILADQQAPEDKDEVERERKERNGKMAAEKTKEELEGEKSSQSDGEQIQRDSVQDVMEALKKADREKTKPDKDSDDPKS